jgi:GNAT superfamily N-acetyltransferase
MGVVILCLPTRPYAHQRVSFDATAAVRLASAVSLRTERIQPSDPDIKLMDWQHVHNAIVPSAAMSLTEVRERVPRYRLDVTYRDGVLVGCTTIRPADGGAVTVIVRVLPEHRRQGIGGQLYERLLAEARALGGGGDIETVVLESNVDGLRFAEARGFVEVGRYVPDDDPVPFLTMRLAS